MANTHETQTALNFRRLVNQDVDQKNTAGMLCILANVIDKLLNEGVSQFVYRDDELDPEDGEANYGNLADETVTHPCLNGWEIGVVWSTIGLMTLETEYELRFHGVLIAQCHDVVREGWYVGRYFDSMDPDLPCLWSGENDSIH